MNIPKPTPLKPPALKPQPFRLTGHAHKRAAEMGLTMNQIVELIDDPEDIRDHHPTSKYYGDGTVMHMAGEYTAVLNYSERNVVTFLYRFRESWEDNRETLGDGREVRMLSHLPSRRTA